MKLSIVEAARDAPDRIALTGPETLTFRELADRALEQVPRFEGAGVALVVGHNTVDAIASVLGLIEAHIPFALLHPRSSERERAAAIHNVTAEVVIDGSRIERIASPKLRSDRVAPRDGLAVFFTSGTTGEPKAAVLTEEALVASAVRISRRLELRPEDRWIAAMPIAHIGGFSILTRCLLARAEVILEPGFDVDRFQSAVRSGATLVSLVPTMLHRLMARGFDPHDLRAVLVGGALLSDALREAAGHLPILTTYGLTEACSQVTLGGELLEDVEVRIDEGRIHVRGPTLFHGYVGEEPHRGWFDTGDMGEITSGQLQVRGRRTDLIVSGGENVYPAEVEAVLSQCSEVSSVCVFGTPDPEWGEVVSAAMVPRRDPPSEQVLEELIREQLAGHKRPRRLVWVDELPENRAGKVDRNAVRRLVSRS